MHSEGFAVFACEPLHTFLCAGQTFEEGNIILSGGKFVGGIGEKLGGGFGKLSKVGGSCHYCSWGMVRADAGPRIEWMWVGCGVRGLCGCVPLLPALLTVLAPEGFDE